MKLESLTIENFRRFKRVDIEFADGVTALVGRNGAGKSTLLESIGWCLYGNDAARTGKDLIKRRGAAPHEDVRVQLSFRFGAHMYDVTRELLGKNEQHSASVKVDGKIVVASGAQSSKEATAYVERLFHMEREAFFTSLVARQRELSALTDALPSARKKILIGLLRLDAVDAAIDEARAQRRLARAELTGLRSAMVDSTVLTAQVQEATKNIALKKAALQEVEERITRLIDEVEDLRQQRDSGRKLADEHKQILAEAAVLDARLLHLKTERARCDVQLQKAREAGAEATTLLARVELLPAAIERVQTLAARGIQHQELVRLRAELLRADTDAGAALKDAEAARASLAVNLGVRAEAQRIALERPTLELALAQAQRRVTEIETAAREIAKQVNDVSGKEKKVRAIGPEAPCPSCTRPLREHYSELLFAFTSEAEVLRATLGHMSPELDAARKAETAAREALARLTSHETALRAALERLAADEARVATSSARHADAVARASRLRDQEAALAGAPFDPRELEAVKLEQRALELARDRHARLSTEAEREAEILGLLGELTLSEGIALAERAALDKRRAVLAFDPVAHDNLERLAQARDARLTEERVLREKHVGQRIRLEDEQGRLLAALAQQEELAHRAEGLGARVLLLEQLAGERDGGLLPEFKDHLIGRIRPLLSLHAGRLFRELTEGRYADLEVDDDYDLIVHDEGEAFALARFSGGESDLANLCLRLAVSQVVAERAGTEGFGFLALDEIFGSQDEVRKGNILRALASLSGRFRQILLITHIVDVKESADHVLRVETLDDGTSRIVVEG